MLEDRYRQRGIVLVLGAGVSADCKIPDWPELLRRMADATTGGPGAEVVDALISQGWSLPSIAALLEYSRGRTSLRQIARTALYRDFPVDAPANTQAKRDALVQFVEDNNSTMHSVSQLCAVRKGKAVVPNPRIAAVANFNLDAILRSYSRAKYEEWLFRTVKAADAVAGTNRISIYHMHGLIPFYAVGDDQDIIAEHFVLTEHQYFDFFNRPNSVFNYTFLYLLREYNCLFIGMSMRDDNIRRLLHYSTSERKASTGTLPSSDGSPSRTALRHFAIIRRSDSRQVDRLTEISLRGIGTRVLWVEQFDEIPRRLSEVYESANDDWASVA